MTNKTIQDNVFGTLIYDARFGYFRGQVYFGTKIVKIDIRFESQPEHVSADELRQAQAVYFALAARKAEIEAEIVREYLPLYNETWRDGDKINEDQFLTVLEPENIDIEYGRPHDLWYVAGDLFTDHSILVVFKDDGSIRDISLAG